MKAELPKKVTSGQYGIVHGWCQRLVTVFLVSLVWGYPGVQAGEAENAQADPSGEGDILFSAGGEEGQKQPQDFRDLSLEELLDLEVVPISILGTHTHLAGEWMIGYQYMFMRMDGNRGGTSRLSVDDVHNDFPVAPTDMDMEMHMPMLMYAPSDNLTLMAMLPYIRLKMDHITRTGIQFRTTSQGIGDLKVSGLYTFYRVGFDRHRLIFDGGISFPTGSINEKDFLANPANGKKKLPYTMQLGSGTVDLHPGITYLGQAENWGWGAEVHGTVRLGENSDDYTLGDQFLLSAWADWRWTDWLAPFVRIDGQVWGNIDGADPELNPALVPTADPNSRGGKRVDLILGINSYAPKGALKGHRLGIQIGAPVYQSLDGPQLEVDLQITAGWQWVF